MATKPTKPRSTADGKSSNLATKTQRKPAKPAITDLEIVQELSGDPSPLSFARYPGDFFAVILSDGRKFKYGPAAVRAAIDALK